VDFSKVTFQVGLEGRDGAISTRMEGWVEGRVLVKGTEVAEVQTAGAQHTWKAQVVEGGQGSWACLVGLVKES